MKLDRVKRGFAQIAKRLGRRRRVQRLMAVGTRQREE